MSGPTISDLLLQRDAVLRFEMEGERGGDGTLREFNRDVAASGPSAADKEREILKQAQAARETEEKDALIAALKAQLANSKGMFVCV